MLYTKFTQRILGYSKAVYCYLLRSVNCINETSRHRSNKPSLQYSSVGEFCIKNTEQENSHYIHLLRSDDTKPQALHHSSRQAPLAKRDKSRLRVMRADSHPSAKTCMTLSISSIDKKSLFQVSSKSIASLNMQTAVTRPKLCRTKPSISRRNVKRKVIVVTEQVV